MAQILLDADDFNSKKKPRKRFAGLRSSNSLDAFYVDGVT